MKKGIIISLFIIIIGFVLFKAFFLSPKVVTGTEMDSHISEPPIHILAGIDSLTNGPLYAATKSRYFDDFVPELKKTYGDGGPGYVPFDTRYFKQEGGVFTYSNGLKEINNIPHDIYPSPYSFDFKGVFTTNGHFDSITMQLKDTWKYGKLFYLKQPNGGTFEVGYTRGNVIKVNTKGAIGIGVFVLPPHVAHQHIIVKHIHGSIVLFGGLFYNPTGVVVSRVGQGGDQLAWYTKLNQDQLGEWLRALQPDLFIFNGGMNDRKWLTADQYEIALNKYLTPFRLAQCPILLTIPNAIRGDNTRLEAYANKLNEYAKKNGTGLVSNKEVLGQSFQEANSKGYMGDHIHPNDRGSRLISRHLLLYIDSHPEFHNILIKGTK